MPCPGANVYIAILINNTLLNFLKIIKNRFIIAIPMSKYPPK